MIVNEERILQPQNPVPDNLNDWPDFILTDAKVRVSGTLVYASLLDARPEHPLTVTGKVSRLDKQRERLVTHPNYTQIQLRINSCTQFAFGQDPTGRSLVWAAGRAGWFEIIPSARYVSLYEDIKKAIDLIYFLSDAHKTFARRRPIRGAKVEELLTLYLQHSDYRIDEDAEAEAVFDKHHSFLIRQMLEGWEGINWARTHLWHYFSRRYPDEVAPDSGSGEQDESTDEAESSDADISRDTEDGNTWADILYDELMRQKASGHMGKQHCSIDELTKLLLNQYEISSRDEANVIVKEAAIPLIRYLDADPHQGGSRTWSKKLIYRQLQNLARLERIANETRDEMDLESFTEPPPNRRHRKSILRPSSVAGKGRKRMLGRESSPEDEIDEEEMVDETVASPTQGNETPSKKKRVAFDLGMSPVVGRVTNGTGSPNKSQPSAPFSQRDQLELIRKESVANGRPQTNNLEALIEHLIQARG